MLTIPGERIYFFALRGLKDYRGKGIATQLMKYVMDCYKEEGIYEFTIGVEEDNEIAKHLYNSLGFEYIARKFDKFENEQYELLLHKEKAE